MSTGHPPPSCKYIFCIQWSVLRHSYVGKFCGGTLHNSEARQSCNTDSKMASCLRSQSNMKPHIILLVWFAIIGHSDTGQFDTADNLTPDNLTLQTIWHWKIWHQDNLTPLGKTDNLTPLAKKDNLTPRTIWHWRIWHRTIWHRWEFDTSDNLTTRTNCPQCQIFRCQIVLVSNCPQTLVCRLFSKKRCPADGLFSSQDWQYI